MSIAARITGHDGAASAAWAVQRGVDYRGHAAIFMPCSGKVRARRTEFGITSFSVSC